MVILKKSGVWFILVILLALEVWLQVSLWQIDARKFDIYYLYQDSQRLLNGENPYMRVLKSNMQTNDKYTTIFPVFIELSTLTQRFFFDNFMGWLSFWRWVFLICNLGIMILLYGEFIAYHAPYLALLFTAFWAFNRWTLYISRTSGFDFIPILLMLISLLLHHRRRWLGMGFYSLSLAFKQIGIFLLPLYLIETYHSTGKKWLGRVSICGFIIASVPVLTSLPFLFWNLKGFVYSILFSATRNPFQFKQSSESVDMLIHLSGIPSRLPMLLMLLVVYIVAWRNKLNMLLASMLAMAIFVAFNPVFFDQYMPWFILTLLLSIEAWFMQKKS